MITSVDTQTARLPVERYILYDIMSDIMFYFHFFVDAFGCIFAIFSKIIVLI